MPKFQLPGASAENSWKQKQSGVEINIPAPLKKASNHVWVLKIQNKAMK
jgi:hypothetical protein